MFTPMIIAGVLLERQCGTTKCDGPASGQCHIAEARSWVPGTPGEAPGGAAGVDQHPDPPPELVQTIIYNPVSNFSLDAYGSQQGGVITPSIVIFEYRYF